MSNIKHSPNLSWTQSTAYDFFVSLFVLHHPADFGLRLSWAAGVRSRLPAEQRDFLELAQGFLPAPLPWLSSLGADSLDTSAMLDALAKIPAGERLEKLLRPEDLPPVISETLARIRQQGHAEATDLEVLRVNYLRRGKSIRPAAINSLADAWSDPQTFGERYLEAAVTYQQVFFQEEEERIRPALESGLEEARRLAQDKSFPDLIETLTRGVSFDFGGVKELILAPSYWCAPLVIYSRVTKEKTMLLFGCRPADTPLVPGDMVPTGVVTGLKALADPTRLRILHYLSHEPLTPTNWPGRLRLRPPTVIHHLNLLRLSGLVQVSVLTEGERRYALRSAELNTLLSDTQNFIGS